MIIKSKNLIGVGLMTVLSISLFFATAAFIGRWQTSSNALLLKIRFQFLDNLTEGSPVRIAGGVKIGYVEKIYQEDLNVYVNILLNKEYHNRIPREGSSFAIYRTGLIGPKYINLTLPNSEFIRSLKVSKEDPSPFLQSNEVINGIDPPSVDQMFLSFSNWFQGKDGGQVLAETMQETRSFIGNLNSIASENRGDIRKTIKRARSSFEKLSSQLDVLMTKLNLFSKNVTEISDRNKQDIKEMLTNLSLISKDLNLITARISQGRGNIGKFVKDEKLYRNANAAVDNARLFFKVLKEKPWMIMYKEN